MGVLADGSVASLENRSDLTISLPPANPKQNFRFSLGEIKRLQGLGIRFCVALS